MSEVKWVKIKVDIFNDEKIQLIETMPDADTIIVIWFKLLALAGIKNDGGIVRMNDKMAYTDDMLATIFRRKVSVIILALETFRQFDMIDIVKNAILINNWEKHQNVDGLDKIKLQNKERQQKYRDNQKTLLLENKKEDIDSKSKRTLLRVTQRNVTVKPTKTKYLEFVKLTDDEHNKLKKKFNSRLPNLIENLNNYLGSTGKKYKSHYHTILSWERNNSKNNTNEETEEEFNKRFGINVNT